MAWTSPKTWTVGEVLTAADLNTHLRDNLLGAVGQIGTSVSDLGTRWGGTPPDGARSLLRLGSSPFAHIALVYDATLGKWVSPQPEVVDWDEDISHNTTISTNASRLRVVARNVAAAYAAGLKVQYQISFTASNDSGSFGYVLTTWYSADGDAGGIGTAGSAWTATAGLSATRVPASGNLTTGEVMFADAADTWRDVPAGATTKELLAMAWGVQSNASPSNTTTTFRVCSIRWRWVGQ